MHAAVIGGGIGGLAASIALRNAGHTTEVFERSAIGGIGVGLIITPNGLHALDALGHGIGADVRARGHVLSAHAEHMVLTYDGQSLGTIRYGEFAARHRSSFVVIRRKHLTETLRTVHGPDGLHSGRELAELSGTDRPAGRFRDGAPLAADLLVGADGIRSTVRARLHGPAAPRIAAYTLRGVTVGHPLPAELRDGLTVVGPGLGMFFAPLGTAELYWTATVDAGTDEWPRSPRAAYQRLLTTLHGWPQIAHHLVAGCDPAHLVVTDLADRPPLTSWGRGRTTLLGDAAHPMTNFLGQGANTTLEDAVVLGRRLAIPADPENDLRAYERERIDRTTPIVAAAGNLTQGEWGRDTPERFRRFLEDFLNGAFMHGVYGWTATSTPGSAGEVRV
ncbi:FAD-dependent oxidoreductase [Micromonospora craniellae]|uniref:FAD-binding domain-containing protein n=1 Tax=Micromonospora craniellae TaxID=2294034 RepID=A0A372FXU9_9ACTN|nr:FAD-dependent monooxygenase [Micromonospora craniellae]RFS45615.1 hypothetical protein D0Q02_16105 [Micromonospora craniellae]